METHLTRQLLDAVAKGEKAPSELVPLVLAHLWQLCPRCEAELEAWKHQPCAAPEPQDPQYRNAFERARAWAAEHSAVVTEERRRAGPRLAELLRLPAGERLAAVEEAPERYQGAVLGDLLIEASRGELPGRPREAYALAKLARAVLDQSPISGVVSELYARAVAYMANALRATGEIQEAAEIFHHARFILRSSGGGDRRTRAEFDHIEGVLRRAERRLDIAERLLARAVAAYRLEKVPLDAARALLSLAMVHREQGSIERAIATTRKAIRLAQSEGEPRLILYCEHNLASLLCTAGEVETAREIVRRNLPLYRRYRDPLAKLRLGWLEARIARGLGQTEAAEAKFLAVREGFLEEGIGFDAALVSLELATFYAERGLTAEVKRLADEITPVFEAQDIHREATAALLLFQEAARAEELTLGLIGELVSFLKSARLNPSLTFRTTH